MLNYCLLSFIFSQTSWSNKRFITICLYFKFLMNPGLRHKHITHFSFFPLLTFLSSHFPSHLTILMFFLIFQIISCRNIIYYSIQILTFNMLILNFFKNTFFNCFALMAAIFGFLLSLINDMYSFMLPKGWVSLQDGYDFGRFSFIRQ